jgi:hypothetical protein
MIHDYKNQCCSVEKARRLKELGVKQFSLFYWDIISEDVCSLNELPEYHPGIEWYSAFNVAELMNILPAYIDTGKNEPFNGFWFSLNKRLSLNIRYIVNYYCDTSPYGQMPYSLMEHNIYDEKLADCLAKMLIYLLENELMYV